MGELEKGAGLRRGVKKGHGAFEVTVRHPSGEIE